MRVAILLFTIFVFASHGARLDLLNASHSKKANSTTYVFETPQTIAAILQINGTNNFVLQAGPQHSWWESSNDGQEWRTIPGTSEQNDSRILRLLELKRPITTKYLRLQADQGSCVGEALFDRTPKWEELARWILIVNSTDDRRLPGHGQEFFPLARSVPGWEKTRAQQIWVGDLTLDFIETEPRPVAVLFSGSFKDWCEVERRDWSGAESILKKAVTPIWASCGGAQALAILAETGTAREWDCPHCRDPRAPKLPIYTHIGHTVEGKSCGDYSACIFEKGPHHVRKVGSMSVFEGLPEEFKVMESHCGQISWPPKNWELIATAGSDSLTQVQCIKRIGLPIYAAQFHIEMSGTPESSRVIMGNFLREAEAWQKLQN